MMRTLLRHLCTTARTAAGNTAAGTTTTRVMVTPRQRRHFGSSNDDDGSTADAQRLLSALRELDTASLCDAAEQLRQTTTKNEEDGRKSGSLQVLDSKIRPINPKQRLKMVGYAFTVQCTVKNDFLAVLRGLVESSGRTSISQSSQQLVLVVDTLNSVRAVSGELFATQAWHYNHMAGLLIDGPVRDSQQLQRLDMPIFATGHLSPCRHHAASRSDTGTRASRWRDG